jgi:hypothetical protein
VNPQYQLAGADFRNRNILEPDLIHATVDGRQHRVRNGRGLVVHCGLIGYGHDGMKVPRLLIEWRGFTPR